jgi:hypothetical protein
VNWITAHLLLIGLPALGLPTGLVLLVTGQVRRSDRLRRAGLVILVVASLAGLATFAAGRRAATQVEATVPGVDPELILRHAAGAEAARLALVVLAAASAGVLCVRRDSGALPWLIGGLAVFGLVAVLLVGRAALYGGEIRHPALRGQVSAVRPAPSP